MTGPSPTGVVFRHAAKGRDAASPDGAATGRHASACLNTTPVGDRPRHKATLSSRGSLKVTLLAYDLDSIVRSQVTDMHHNPWFVAHALCYVVLTLGASTLLGPDLAFAQNPRGDGVGKPIEPEEPVRAILAAFESHDIVALDEGRHGNEQGHELRLKLIRHPIFARRVNDIVVEFGSARYQELMDRYIRCEDVAAGELRRAWQDTTQHAVWDVPIYEEFVRAVRQVNESLPKDPQLRVLLADPPIDCAVVKLRPTISRGCGCETHSVPLWYKEKCWGRSARRS